MYKKVPAIIMTLFIILAVISESLVPLHNNAENYAENIRKDILSRAEDNRYKYVSAKNNKSRNNSIDMDKPILISHRGANRIAPENSIPAIDAAGKAGYWGVELDVCSSSDGVLYLLHDGTLDRTTDGKGLITAMTSEQIDKYRICRGVNISLYHNLRIPRFEDVLSECAKYNLVPVFDFKLFSNTKRDINTFISIIKKHGYEDKVMVHSFNHADIKYLHSRDKKIFAMPIINPQHKTFGNEYTKKYGITGLDCKYIHLTKEIVNKAHKYGLKVFCWDVDDKSSFKKAKDMGVDFIYTDNIYPGKKAKQI